MSMPPTGTQPNGVPITVPRSQGRQERFQSRRDMRKRPTVLRVVCTRRSYRAEYSTSPTTNRPTATSTMSTPSVSAGQPPVSRSTPLTDSTPTQASASPTNKAVTPRSVLLPTAALTAPKASTISMKVSAWPSPWATPATQGATHTTSSDARVPAMNEPIAAVASATPARPFRAMRCPSMAVTMLALSPGVLSRMEAVEPPYMPPQAIAMKKMKASVMPTWKVMGSSSATATEGPNPGSTPRAVPSRQPARANIRCSGVLASTRPCHKACITSMASSRPAASRPARG